MCFEARLRGYEADLAEFPRERSAVADALTYCDVTTSATGQPVSLKERAAKVLRQRRYCNASPTFVDAVCDAGGGAYSSAIA
jgi:hypothetical protein